MVKHISPILKMVTVCLLLASCGWVEVKPEAARPTFIPKPAPVKPLPSSQVRVKKGDTLYSIAQERQVSLSDLIAENKLRAPFQVQVGQLLTLPQPTLHTVRKGDTLSSLAQTYKTNIYSLSQLNKLSSPYVLRIGDTLKVPKRESSAKNTPIEKISPSLPSKAVTARKTKPQIDRNTRAPPPKRAGRTFIWPLKGQIISRFGPKKGGLHNDGINILARKGTTVRAAENGVVAYSGNELRGFGNMILLKHADNWITAYAHLENVTIERGDTIIRGQKIATIGQTGGVTRPQLHFEVRKKMSPVDPLKYLEK